MSPYLEKWRSVCAALQGRLAAKPKTAHALIWLLAALGSVAAGAWLNHRLGERFEYPAPRLTALPCVLFLGFSLGVTLLLAGCSRTLRFAVGWIGLSLVAGVCFYPFLCSGESFVITNFLSANWAYPFSQTQPAAKLVNPEPHDSFMMYFPFKYAWTEAIRHFSFPFWDFARNSGMPFVAATLTGAFYPLNAIFLLAGTESGWGVVGLIHLLVAGTGMFLLAERLTQSRFAGLYAGLTFMLMPYLAGWSRGLVWNSTGVWLPLICFFCVDALTKRSVRSAALAALALTVATFGGWIQWVLYIYMILGLGAALYVVFQLVTGQQRAALHSALIFCGIIVLALMLSLIHLGPFHEVAGLQPRSVVPWTQVAAMERPFGAAANLAYLIPDLFGNHVDGVVAPQWSFLEYQRYLGVLCFPLITLAFLRRETVALALCLVVPGAFFISVSQLGFGYWLLYHLVPGFDAIPSQQTRALFIIGFVLLLLSALGAANLRRLITGRPAALTVVLIVWAIAYLLLALVVLLDVFGLKLTDELRVAGGTHSIVISAAFLVAGLLMTLFTQGERRGSVLVAFTQLTVLLVCAGELVLFHHKAASFSRPLADKEPPMVTEIKAGGNLRFFRTGGLPITYAFIQNSAAMIYGLHDTMAWDSIYLANYGKFFALFNPASDYHNPHTINSPKIVDRSNIELIRMLNVDYIFHKETTTGTKVDAASFDRNLVDYVRLDDGRHVLRVKNPLPRAFFVQKVKYATESDMMTALQAPEFKATDVAYVADQPPLPDLATTGQLATMPEVPIDYRESGPNTFVLHYKSSTARHIFISNVMYPGWQAVTSHGDRLPIYQANLAFMLLQVPAATDGEVVFTYRPTHFSLYELVFVAAFLATLTAIAKPGFVTAKIFQFSAGLGIPGQKDPP